MQRTSSIAILLLALVVPALAVVFDDPTVADERKVALLPGVQAPATVLPAASPVAADAPVLPPVDPASGFLGVVFEQARTVATARSPLTVDQSGTFVQIQDQYNVELPSPEVVIADFYTIATFVNPTDLSIPADVGVGFRADFDKGIEWQIMLRSNGRWYLLQPGPQPIASGSAESFDTAPGASNTIEVTAQGGHGLIVVNGVVLGQLDLSMLVEPGNIYLGTGFIRADTKPGREVSYRDWWIYPLGASETASE